MVINPTPIVLEEYRFRQRESELERARLHRLRHMPSVTLDGQPVELLANIELPGDAATALEAGAVGVGLFRSEFLFMNRNGELPDEDEQFEAYRAAVVAMAGLPVTIRTVDIGADKPLDRMGSSGVAPRACPQPRARPARHSLEPVGAGDVPPAAARHPARQRLWQGARPDPDAGAPQRDPRDAGRPGARAPSTAGQWPRSSPMSNSAP